MSALRDSLAEYLALRRALGTGLREPGMALAAFVAFWRHVAAISSLAPSSGAGAPSAFKGLGLEHRGRAGRGKASRER